MDNHPHAAWVTSSGKNVRLTVCHGSRFEASSQKLLIEADHVVDCLSSLVKPSGQNHDIVHIIIADPADLMAKDLPPTPGATTHEHETCRVVYVAGHDDPLVVPVEPIVIELLEHWFGRQAAKHESLIAGLSGYVAAIAQVGPSVADADRWVQAELDAGRFVSTLNCTLDAKNAKCGGPPTWNNAVCISFVAYLLENNGSAALRQYFRILGSAEHDSAAMAAFKQPLAVIEEAWLATMRRRSLHRNELVSLLRRILPLLSAYKWRQAEMIGLTLLAAAYNMVWPIATQRFIRMLAGHLKSSGHAGHPAAISAAGHAFFVHNVAPFLVVLFALYLLDAAVTMRRTYAASWINVQVLNHLRERMYAHILALSHDFYSNAKCADLMARLNDDIQNVQQALQQVTNKSFYQIFTLTGGIITLIALNTSRWQLTASVLLIVPLFAVVYASLKSRNKSASREQRKRVSQTATATQESLLAHATIKAFGLQSSAMGLYAHRLALQGRSQLKLAMLSALSDLSEDMVTALAQLVIFGVGGYMLLVYPSQGADHGVGDLAAALLLVKVIFGPITSLSGVGQTMQQAAGAMERVSDLFEEPIAVADKPGAVPLPPLASEIRFSQVKFGYGSQRSILRRLDLTIPAGANVAIVGATGSGKTTIVNLLMRFWDAESGSVTIDGHDIRDVTVESLRSQIGIVFQDTFIFDTTVMENIRVGRAGASDTEVIEAAKAASLHADIADIYKFPAGYETVLGEGGGRLSGGQRQRIAIARAILRNPHILILDEATSALDAKTEADLQETISNLAKTRTTISVTHRLSWAATADIIFVLDDGQLAEQGTHAALVRAGGLYQRLYEEQTGYVQPSEHGPVLRRRFAVTAPARAVLPVHQLRG